MAATVLAIFTLTCFATGFGLRCYSCIKDITVDDCWKTGFKIVCGADSIPLQFSLRSGASATTDGRTGGKRSRDDDYDDDDDDGGKIVKRSRDDGYGRRRGHKGRRKDDDYEFRRAHKGRLKDDDYGDDDYDDDDYDDDYDLGGRSNKGGSKDDDDDYDFKRADDDDTESEDKSTDVESKPVDASFVCVKLVFSDPFEGIMTINRHCGYKNISKRKYCNHLKQGTYFNTTSYMVAKATGGETARGDEESPKAAAADAAAAETGRRLECYFCSGDECNAAIGLIPDSPFHTPFLPLSIIIYKYFCYH